MSAYLQSTLDGALAAPGGLPATVLVLCVLAVITALGIGLAIHWLLLDRYHYHRRRSLDELWGER